MDPSRASRLKQPFKTRPSSPIRFDVWIVERMRYPINQPTNRPTDTASYRGALSHLTTRPGRPIRCDVWIVERMRYPTDQPTNRSTDTLPVIHETSFTLSLVQDVVTTTSEKRNVKWEIGAESTDLPLKTKNLRKAFMSIHQTVAMALFSLRLFLNYMTVQETVNWFCLMRLNSSKNTNLRSMY